MMRVADGGGMRFCDGLHVKGHLHVSVMKHPTNILVPLLRLDFCSWVAHEEHPRSTALHTMSLVQHFCHAGHDTSLVAFVAEQGYLKIITESGKTGVFDRSPVEDGK